MIAPGSARRLPITRCLRSRRFCWSPPRLRAWCSVPRPCAARLSGQLDHLVGREGALAVESLLEGASQRRAGIFATAIGGITFIVAATGAFLELQVALNTIWRVKPRPSGHLQAFVIDRLRSFGLWWQSDFCCWCRSW